MLGTVANGFGLVGLAGLLAEAQSRRPRSRRQAAALRAQGQSGDLHLPERRSVARRPSRPQAPAGRRSRQAAAIREAQAARTTTENLMASPFGSPGTASPASPSASCCPTWPSCVDDLCVIRSMVADNINHPNACLQMLTGEQVFSRPSLGSWLLYGLGSENQDLPGFVAICPSGGDAALWGSSFLPASFQGTRVADLAHPIANLGNGRLSNRRATAPARPRQPAQPAAPGRSRGR